jgi:putative DNA methylase
MEVEQPDERSDRAHPGDATLLERGFPFREVSLVAKADRRANDPAYGAHRWWARRPPALLRATLLAAAQPHDVDLERFWRSYETPGLHLRGWRVHDPFIGGGSTLVEAARLGATVSGGDVDPLAVEIVRYALRPATPEAIREAGADLFDHVRTTCGHLYPTSGVRQPLHYFWLHEVCCPYCHEQGLLYKDLVIARDRGKPGAVVRDQPLVVFCPEDLAIVGLNHVERVELRKGGRRWRIDEGTFVRNRYRCPHCGKASLHKDLATGVASRRLLAVEETAAGERRTIRSPSQSDLSAITAASTWIEEHGESLGLPDTEFAADRHDDRPRSYGVTRVIELFTDRQLAVLGTAFTWLRNSDLEPEVGAGLRLAISNALATNNKLCSYAYDYGRLSALFSVRGYSLPALPVELNPLHDDAGRGTLRQCIERVARAGAAVSRRHVWSPSAKRAAATSLAVSANADVTNVGVVSATAAPTGTTPSVDLCVFDPPYFDYIAYSELSEFYRAWLESPAEPAAPLLPDGDDPGESFGLNLGVALRSVLARLAPGRPLAFTYHSTNPEAWRAIGIAIDEAKLRITGLFPVYSDGHMGHHSHPGNCEWDLVLVCRRATETVSAEFTGRVRAWAQQARPLKIGKADRTSIELAIAIAAPRFGNPAKES